jgi:hypothetical protein
MIGFRQFLAETNVVPLVPGIERPNPKMIDHIDYLLNELHRHSSNEVKAAVQKTIIHFYNHIKNNPTQRLSFENISNQVDELLHTASTKAKDAAKGAVTADYEVGTFHKNLGITFPTH